MKIAIECHSVLLKKALYLFLQPFVVPLKQCDFVIADYDANLPKPTFFIGTPRANLLKPFSKEMLYDALKKYYKQLHQTDSSQILLKQKDEQLEKKIECLTQEFSQNLITVLREYYEK